MFKCPVYGQEFDERRKKHRGHRETTRGKQHDDYLDELVKKRLTRLDQLVVQYEELIKEKKK